MKAGTISTEDLLMMEDVCRALKDEWSAYVYLRSRIGMEWTIEHDRMFKYFRGYIFFTSPE